MERLLSLAKDVEGREPSIEEAIELLVCIATAHYGVNPETVRHLLKNSPVQASNPPVDLPLASALALARCRADAVRILAGRATVDHGPHTVGHESDLARLSEIHQDGKADPVMALSSNVG